MLVAENPAEAAADAEDDDDEVTSDDEVMAPSFCDASRNMSPSRLVYMWITAEARPTKGRRSWLRGRPRKYDQTTGIVVAVLL